MPHKSIHPASGAQFSIESGQYQAVITSVGATLRSLTHAGRDLVVPFQAEEVRPLYRGANLVPWPNRIADGAYSCNGKDEQLPINEVDRMTSLHGLVLWNNWELRAETPSSVTLGAVVEPQAGYPHRLEIEAAYTLTDEGLTWRVSAVNVGTGAGTLPAPYGVAPHPYLVAGDGRVDAWTLTLPAAEVLQVTAERLLPTELADVAVHDGGYFDFQQARELRATKIDHAYTALPDAALAEVRLSSPDGTGVLMRWNPQVLPWVQIHTADRPENAWNRIGLAVEPMSCPPDAFNSGKDLITLACGERHDASWIIAAL
ncbi:aldose 1-epimerase family protein [Specibacter sp. NPDC057265]|uniref:aldose 1-epimerase family protein n=1 Tax=Specibacter sp. NPDC057265 TaxID=3346075 RepID=UPI0036254CAD